MILVLEWRGFQPSVRSTRGLVSHVRLFRTVAALKAFVRSRSFARWASSELRLSRRGDDSAGPIITDAAAILAWDAARTSLPTAMVASEWERDLVSLCLNESIGAAIARELDRARRANLLSRSHVRQILELLAECLAHGGARPD